MAASESRQTFDNHVRRVPNAYAAGTLFAVVANADLRVGRTREALDAIDALHPTVPEVGGLAETLGTLVEAVAEGVLRDATLIGPASDALDRVADAAGATRIAFTGARDAIIRRRFLPANGAAGSVAVMAG